MGLLDSVWAESVYGYCLWVFFELKSLFLEKFVSLESEITKERKLKRKKRESKKERAVGCKLA